MCTLLFVTIFSYSRMPGELLPKVIMSLHAGINEGFPFKNDKTGLLVSASFPLCCFVCSLSYLGFLTWTILVSIR